MLTADALLQRILDSVEQLHTKLDSIAERTAKTEVRSTENATQIRILRGRIWKLVVIVISLASGAAGIKLL